MHSFVKEKQQLCKLIALTFHWSSAHVSAGQDRASAKCNERGHCVAALVN